MAENTDEKSYLFTSEKQPKRRGKGRPKNVFGPLAKADDLTSNDLKKICKNLLKCNPNNLMSVVEKYPTVLTVTLANMITQDLRGELTGKMEKTGRMIPSGKVDKKGNPKMEPEFRPERKRSFNTVKFLIEYSFGKPVQTDVIVGIGISEESEQRIFQIFSEAFEESEQIVPRIVSEKAEYVEPDDYEQ